MKPGHSFIAPTYRIRVTYFDEDTLNMKERELGTLDESLFQKITGIKNPKKFFSLDEGAKNLVDGFLVDDSVDGPDSGESMYIGAMASIFLHNPVADSEQDAELAFASKIFKTGSVVDIWVGEGTGSSSLVSNTHMAFKNAAINTLNLGLAKDVMRYAIYKYDYKLPYSDYYAYRKDLFGSRFVSGHVFRGVVTNINRSVISSSGDKLQVNAFSLPRIVSMYRMTPGVYEHMYKELTEVVGTGRDAVIQWKSVSILDLLGYIMAGLFFNMVNGPSWRHDPFLTPAPEYQSEAQLTRRGFQPLVRPGRLYDARAYGNVAGVLDSTREKHVFKKFCKELFFGRPTLERMTAPDTYGIGGVIQSPSCLWDFLPAFGSSAFDHVPEMIKNLLKRSENDGVDVTWPTFPSIFSVAFRDPDGGKMKMWKKSGISVTEDVFDVFSAKITPDDSLFTTGEQGRTYATYYTIFRRLAKRISSLLDDVEFYIEPSGLFVFRRKEMLPKEIGPMYGSLFTLGKNVKEFRVNSRTDLLRCYSGVEIKFTIHDNNPRSPMNKTFNVSVALIDRSLEKKFGKRYLPYDLDLFYNPNVTQNEHLDPNEFRMLIANIVRDNTQFEMEYEGDYKEIPLGGAPAYPLGGTAAQIAAWRRQVAAIPAFRKSYLESLMLGTKQAGPMSTFENFLRIWLSRVGHELLNFGNNGDIYTIGDPHVRIRNKLCITDDRVTFSRRRGLMGKLLDSVSIVKWLRESPLEASIRIEKQSPQEFSGTVEGYYFIWKVVHYFGASAGTDGFMTKIYFSQSRRHDELIGEREEMDVLYGRYGGQIQAALKRMVQGSGTP